MTETGPNDTSDVVWTQITSFFTKKKGRGLKRNAFQASSKFFYSILITI